MPFIGINIHDYTPMCYDDWPNNAIFIINGPILLIINPIVISALLLVGSVVCDPWLTAFTFHCGYLIAVAWQAPHVSAGHLGLRRRAGPAISGLYWYWVRMAKSHEDDTLIATLSILNLYYEKLIYIDGLVTPLLTHWIYVFLALTHRYLDFSLHWMPEWYSALNIMIVDVLAT